MEVVGCCHHCETESRCESELQQLSVNQSIADCFDIWNAELSIFGVFDQWLEIKSDEFEDFPLFFIFLHFQLIDSCKKKKKKKK